MQEKKHSQENPSFIINLTLVLFFSSSLPLARLHAQTTFCLLLSALPEVASQLLALPS
jgi:hypothetical protein